MYGLAARAIPRMTPTEHPELLWRPIMDLGTPAHHWVEHFFSQWFTDGAQASETSEALTAPWTRMIRHALSHPLWNPATTRHNDLGNMVAELLGFDYGADAIGWNERFTAAIGQNVDTFALAARRWFRLPRVASGFAAFAVRPAAAQLLIPGVPWLSEAVHSFDSSDWTRYDLEANLVEYLRVCWHKEATRISRDPQLRAAFLNLLTRLGAQGGHAATALRDRVLDSISI